MPLAIPLEPLRHPPAALNIQAAHAKTYRHQLRFHSFIARTQPRQARQPWNRSPKALDLRDAYSISRSSSVAPPLGMQYSRSMSKNASSQPRPSASILLISPSNEILLLHRVRTSTSFPSAHVFPGGNLEASQDGPIPGPDDPARHADGPAYRMGAIRECFEESGILLARKKDGSGAFLDVGDEERERARREIHAGRLRFVDWVDSRGGVVDVGGLIPFTRWITPANAPRRFTTQMYIYFFPLPPSPEIDDSSPPSASGAPSASTNPPVPAPALIPVPTSDGGIEHTAALFAPCSTWLRLARANAIILFSPQFYLLSVLEPFLSGCPGSVPALCSLQTQRARVRAFLSDGGGGGGGSGIPWARKVMTPLPLSPPVELADGRAVLALDRASPDVHLHLRLPLSLPGAQGGGRTGDLDRVVLVRFSKEGPRDVEIMRRGDVLGGERKDAESSGNGGGKL